MRKKDGFKDEKLIILPTQSIESFLEHPMVKSLFLTDAGFFPEAQYHFRERREGANEAILLYCIDGEGIIELEDRRIELKRGMLFCIPPHVGHKYYAKEKMPWSILWLHFKGDNMDLFQIDKLKVIELESPKANDRVQFHFITLFEALGNNYTLGNMIYLSQLLSVILSEIYFRENTANSDKSNQYLTSAIHYMYDNLHRELTLSDIAGYMALSKSYLNSIFKKHTNRSPVDFFIHLKMQQACKYLKMTEMLVYEISKNLGYKDQYYFSRIFKKMIGLSPREYRRQNIKLVKNEKLKND